MARPLAAQVDPYPSQTTSPAPTLNRGEPLFQLDDILCPNGQMIDEIEGVGPVFVDGVHFSVDGAMWFARKYGEELIATR